MSYSGFWATVTSNGALCYGADVLSCLSVCLSVCL